MATDDPSHSLRGLLAGLRRRVLLHRRGLAALLLAVAVAAGVGAVRAPAQATTTVWVAARDLDGGGALTGADLRRARLPEAAAPAGAVTREELVGRRLSGPVRAGEPLTDRRVLGAALLEAYPGRSAVPVRLADPGVAELLHPGDRVDLMRADPRGDGPSTLLVPRAVVLSVIRDTPSAIGVPDGPDSGGIVLVAVDAAAAPEVSAAGVAGFLTVALPR
ncbi:hypothetical protein GCM10011519_27790 [Marmoricola endophyticus]|uniref:SAF domain-containing protein n=1 Tax=Marmoricola endophyticus TaxID=2040280 RepID=A0A917BMW0_9ACTN|nr:SAF domain-containing protein [Marmoricola endophyticus]GGF52244.1 hypothetical protein GCM10011519_27790 [Marmoricola endophyticus]